MTDDAFDQTLDDIRDRYKVGHVTISADGSRVEVLVGVDYDNNKDMCTYSKALLRDIEDRLAPFGLSFAGSDVEDSDHDDCDAVEIWIFVRY